MQKGFTLFTALVAVMIIFLGVLVTQAMVGGERGAAEIVSNSEEEAQMLDFANIRRADAVQQFNLKLRVAIARYFSKDEIEPFGMPDNFVGINVSTLESTSTTQQQWEVLKEQFIRQNFGDIADPQCIIVDPLNPSEPIPSECSGRQIVQFTAQGITSTLQIESSTDFDAEIEFAGHESGSAEILFEKILFFVFSRSAQKGEFLEVSDCNGNYLGGQCPGGGFYINLDFSQEELEQNPANPAGPQILTGIPNEVYEALPQIKVTKKASCKFEEGVLQYCFKVLKQPIFPRSVFRIFVPLRIFKAIALAHQAIQIDASAQDGELIFEDAADFKSKLKQIKLGVCDSTQVSININPLPPPYCVTQDWFSCYPRVNFESHEDSIWGISSKACIGHEGLAGIFLLSNVDLGNGFSYNPNQPADPLVSAGSAIKKFVKSGRLEELFSNFSSANQVFNFDDTTQFEMVKNPDSNPPNQFFWDIVVTPKDFNSRTVRFNGTEVGDSKCTKIKELHATLLFQENNPLYIVEVKPFDPAFKARYAVRIFDEEFHDFGPTFDSRESFGECKTEQLGGSYSCPNPNLGPSNPFYGFC